MKHSDAVALRRKNVRQSQIGTLRFCCAALGVVGQGRPMVNSDRIFTTVYGFQVELR